MATRAEQLSRVRLLAASGQAHEIRVKSMTSQDDFARSIGVNTSTISRWERGERVPSGDAALRYGRLLDRLA